MSWSQNQPKDKISKSQHILFGLSKLLLFAKKIDNEKGNAFLFLFLKSDFVATSPLCLALLITVLSKETVFVDKLATKILGKQQIKIKNKILKHAVLLVRKCLDGNTCKLFHGYFQKFNHVKLTRNNNNSLWKPNV